MKQCICKIKNKKGRGTGFFCNIFDKEKKIFPVFITNNHVIDEEIIKGNDIIKVSLNDEKVKINIEINDNRKIYTNIEYDITIIESRKNA